MNTEELKQKQLAIYLKWKDVPPPHRAHPRYFEYRLDMIKFHSYKKQEQLEKDDPDKPLAGAELEAAVQMHLK